MAMYVKVDYDEVGADTSKDVEILRERLKGVLDWLEEQMTFGPRQSSRRILTPTAPSWSERSLPTGGR
ncbi:MAG TPA: hypothetical protein VMR52_05095 [Dehalococcoidia bacterium]|nr:hypothetical protein [Dehalococcoidia bacterium]